MAEKNSVPGSIIGMTIKQVGSVDPGVWLDCQTDATLDMAVETEEEDPCKPTPEELVTTGDVPWADFTPSKRNWNITFSQKMMRASLAASNTNIASLIIAGNVFVEVQFMTAPGQTKSDFDFVYSGTGILTGFTFNAPVTGAATTDSTIQGTGPLAELIVPITT